MGKADNGGEAFPTLTFFDDKIVGTTDGMWLRDYFAIRFAAAACSRASVPDFLHEDGITMMAKESYKRADAMIAERKK